MESLKTIVPKTWRWCWTEADAPAVFLVCGRRGASTCGALRRQWTRAAKAARRGGQNPHPGSPRRLLSHPFVRRRLARSSLSELAASPPLLTGEECMCECNYSLHSPHHTHTSLFQGRRKPARVWMWDEIISMFGENSRHLLLFLVIELGKPSAAM